MTAFIVLFQEESEKIQIRHLAGSDRPTPLELDSRELMMGYVADLCDVLLQTSTPQLDEALQKKARETFSQIIAAAAKHRQQHGAYPTGDIDLAE